MKCGFAIMILKTRYNQNNGYQDVEVLEWKPKQICQKQRTEVLRHAQAFCMLIFLLSQQIVTYTW